MRDDRSYVVLLRVHLFFPDSGSLKAKRAELNSVKAHLRQRMGASVAEVAHQDSWQRSTLAVALAGGSVGRCEDAADAICRALGGRVRGGGRRDRADARRALPAGGAGGAASGLLDRPGRARVTGDRMRRVDEAVREVLSDAITTQLKDPRVGFVTVTAVETAPDLRRARVFVSVLGEEPVRRRSMDGLQSAHGYLQRRVASELRLKNTPALQFLYDDTSDRGFRIAELIDREADA